jgi:hypothetical protein
MRADKTLTRINELEAALWDEITSESTLCDQYGLIPNPTRVEQLNSTAKVSREVAQAQGFDVLGENVAGVLLWFLGSIIAPIATLLLILVSPYSLIPVVLIHVWARYVHKVVNASSLMGAILFVRGTTEEDKDIDKMFIGGICAAFALHVVTALFFIGWSPVISTAHMLLWLSVPLLVLEIIGLIGAKVMAVRDRKATD